MKPLPGNSLSECRDRVRRLESCFEVTSLLNSELDLDSLLRTIIRSAKQVMNADIASMALIDEEHGDLVFQIAMGQAGDHVDKLGEWQRVKLGDGVNGTVAATGKPLLLKDVHDHPTFDTAYEELTGMAFGAMICAPIKVKDKILGSCSVIHDATLGKTFEGPDLSLFQLFCDSAGVAIHNAKAHQAMLKSQRLEQDVSFARSVQEGFLPEAPPQDRRFDFAAQTLPAQMVGGDYYDFLPLGKNEVALFLGDVSGKGFAAALHMARLMSDFRYVSQNFHNPAEVLQQVNGVLCDRPRQQGMFTTVLYAHLDMDERRLRVANAGHHPLLLKRSGSGRITSAAPAGGPPLGISPGAVYEQTELKLNRGDRVLMYSDGLAEAHNKKGKMFGADRIKKVMRSYDGSSLGLLQRMQNELKEFTHGMAPFDDQTLLTLRVR